MNVSQIQFNLQENAVQSESLIFSNSKTKTKSFEKLNAEKFSSLISYQNTRTLKKNIYLAKNKLQKKAETERTFF